MRLISVLKRDIMSIKGKICRILWRWNIMVFAQKSARCIFLQKKYDKQKIELPTRMPSSGILGIKISTTSMKTGREEYNEPPKR